METIERPCKCVHAFQDATYGKGVRVYNVGLKDAKCTVCGNKIKVNKEGK